MAYDSGKGEVLVASDLPSVTNGSATSAQSGAVSVISDTTNKVVATVGVGLDPEALAYDSGKGEVSSRTLLQTI